MKTAHYLLLALTLFLSSCGFKDAEEGATKTLKGLLEQRIIEGGLLPEDAHNDQFWKNMSKDQWVSLSKYMTQTHGNLDSYQIKDVKSVGRKKGFSPEGWVGFTLNTTYKNGIEGIETVNFYRAGKDAPFVVISHHIQTELLKELAESRAASQ